MESEGEFFGVITKGREQKGGQLGFLVETMKDYGWMASFCLFTPSLLGVSFLLLDSLVLLYFQ